MKYKFKNIKELDDAIWDLYLNEDIFKIKDNLCYYVYYDYYNGGKTRIRIINLTSKSIIYEQEIEIEGKHYQSAIDDDNNFHFVIVNNEDNIYYGKLDNKRNLQIEKIGYFPGFGPFPGFDEEETPLSNLIIDNGKPMFIYTKLESHINQGTANYANYGKFYLFYKDTNWNIKPLSYDEANKFKCVYTDYTIKDYGITIDTTPSFFSLNEEPRTPPFWLYDNSVANVNVRPVFWESSSLIYYVENFFIGVATWREPDTVYFAGEILRFHRARSDIYAIVINGGTTGHEYYVTPQITDFGNIIQDGTCAYKIIAHRYYRNMNGQITGLTNPFENNWDRIIQEDTGLIWEAMESGYPTEHDSTPAYYEEGEWIYNKTDPFVIYVVIQPGEFNQYEIPTSTEDGAEVTAGTAVLKVYNFNTKFFRKFVIIESHPLYYPNIYEFTWNPELRIRFDFYGFSKETGEKYYLGSDMVTFYDETNNIIGSIIDYRNRMFPIKGSISKPILTEDPKAYNIIEVHTYKMLKSKYYSGNKFICKINDNNYAFSPGYRFKEFKDGEEEDYIYPDLWTFDLQGNVNNYYNIRQTAPFVSPPYISSTYGLRIYKIDNYLYTIGIYGVNTGGGIVVGTIINKLNESCAIIDTKILPDWRREDLVCITLSNKKFHLLYGVDLGKYDYVVVDSDLNIMFEEEDYIDLTEYPIEIINITDMRIKQDKLFSIPLLYTTSDWETYIALLYKDEYSGLIPLLFFYPYTEEKETKHAIISTRRIKENG